MRIGIDLSRYKMAEATGVECYSNHLVDAMLPLLSRSPEVDEALFYSPRSFELPVKSEKFTKRIIPFARLWTQARLSYEILTKTPDVLFVPSHTIPMIYPRRSVVTIHDVAFRKFKMAYTFSEYRHLMWSTSFSCKNAHKIIVPSESTKSDLMKYFKCDEGKIVVIPHGAPDFIEPSNGEAAAISKWGLESSPYIFFVGRLETKKNLVYLLEAFKDFLKEFGDWKLVLAGKDGAGADDIKKQISELELGAHVVTTGYVDQKEKADLYANAQFVALPSLHEGFGFPILEAFQYNKPIITSRGSACGEVAGDAALLVDPHDKSELCAGMKNLAMNHKLCDELVVKGAERLENFSWDVAAEKTLEVLMS